MKIVILGGGNIGMALAGEISAKRHDDVTLVASHPKAFCRRFEVEDVEQGRHYRSGEIYVTDDMRSVASSADVVLCTYPANLRKRAVKILTSCMKPGSALGFFSAYGGAEYYCQDLIRREVIVFGLEKVPYVARMSQRGKSVSIMSKKNRLYVGVIPSSEADKIAEMVGAVLETPCCAFPNYLSATILPGNPLLHTCGSYVYLKDFTPGQHFDHQIGYWSEWTDECSQVIYRMSGEMIDICNKMPIDLSSVKSIPEYYESPQPQDFTHKVRAIPSFQCVKLPMVADEKGWVPDFSARFFIEDFPFGVAMLKSFAILERLETPTIDELLIWYKRMTGKEYFLSDGSFGKDFSETACPQLFGLTSMDAFINFYI